MIGVNKMNNTQDFIRECKETVASYNNNEVERDTVTSDIWVDDVHVVWYSKTLQHKKALLITNQSDGRYYEVTFNGIKKELYLDVYKKETNIKYEI